MSVVLVVFPGAPQFSKEALEIVSVYLQWNYQMKYILGPTFCQRSFGMIEKLNFGDIIVERLSAIVSVRYWRIHPHSLAPIKINVGRKREPQGIPLLTGIHSSEW